MRLGRSLLLGQPARTGGVQLVGCALSLLSLTGVAACWPAQVARAMPYGQGAAHVPHRYILGPGDRLRMSLFRLEGYEGLVEVLPDGTVTLPRLGSVTVAGLTLDQARERITRGYAAILRRPIVYLDLVSARPLRITVTGEVQRPGLYTLSRSENQRLEAAGPASNAAEMQRMGMESGPIQSSGWPTLVEAIQKAGGLTARGDLRRVTLTRVGPGGREQVREVNFWDALHRGKAVANPLLVDGDRVTIPSAPALSRAELVTLGSSTFAPDTITVNVVGEVMRPGPVSIKANSPMSTAILAAGGLNRQRASTTGLQLLRLEPDGSVKEQKLNYQPTAAMGSEANPSLQQGDVVVVQRHGWAATTDAVRMGTEPVGSLLNAASLIRLLGVPF